MKQMGGALETGSKTWMFTLIWIIFRTPGLTHDILDGIWQPLPPDGLAGRSVSQVH